MTELDYIHQLRNELIQRLANDWQTQWKGKGHGDDFIGFPFVKNKNSLYNELRAEVYKAIETRLGPDEARARFVSTDSIRRLLDERYQSSFAEKVKDAISIYLGYDSWENFKATQGGLQVSHKSVPQPPVSLIWGQKKPLVWMALVVMGLSVLIVFPKSKLLNSKPTSDLDTALLIKCVKQAGQSEFIAYQNLPDKVDTATLQRFFTKDGAAYKRIKTILIKSQQKHQCINNEENPSIFEIASVRFVKV